MKKKCPFCAEEISISVTKCPFCAEDLSAETANQSVPPQQKCQPDNATSNVSTPSIQVNIGAQQLQQPKSNAPLILGIIATVLCVPSVLCAMVCASAATAAGGGALGAIPMIYILAVLACFICSFLAKSDHALMTGIFTIIGALVVIITSFLTMNIIFGLSGGICYLIGGIMSCINNNR